MSSLRKTAAFLVLLGLLAGCASAREPIKPAEKSAAPATVDWSKARRVSVVLDSFDFAPDHLAFTRGQPYLLHLENHSSSGHNFDAPEFFRTLSLKSGAAAESIGAAGGLVEVRPNAEADVYFVPTKAGHFPLKCSHFLHASFGMVGDIVVE